LSLREVESDEWSKVTSHVSRLIYDGEIEHRKESAMWLADYLHTTTGAAGVTCAAIEELIRQPE
jgi:hypothetical protein